MMALKRRQRTLNDIKIADFIGSGKDKNHLSAEDLVEIRETFMPVIK